MTPTFNLTTPPQPFTLIHFSPREYLHKFLTHIRQPIGNFSAHRSELHSAHSGPVFAAPTNPGSIHFGPHSHCGHFQSSTFRIHITMRIIPIEPRSHEHESRDNFVRTNVILIFSGESSACDFPTLVDGKKYEPSANAIEIACECVCYGRNGREIYVRLIVVVVVVRVRFA